jgi:pullulanase/glycogen debranching enzyme
LAGDTIQKKDRRGRAIEGETLFLLFNAHHEKIHFVLPAHQRGVRWEMLLSTSAPEESMEDHAQFRGRESFDLKARSIAVLRLQ